MIVVGAGDQDSGLRLAELVAAFSLATDLGRGQPMEHVLRSWLIAVRLGERLGLEIRGPGGALLRHGAGVVGLRGRLGGGGCLARRRLACRVGRQGKAPGGHSFPARIAELARSGEGWLKKSGISGWVGSRRPAQIRTKAPNVNSHLGRYSCYRRWEVCSP
jgi:hypothetical protein